MTTFQNVLKSALYSKLSGGTALTALLSSGGTSIYENVAPDDANYAYVVFNIQSSGDENYTPNRTKDVLMQVRGYTDASQKAAGAIADQIDSLLHGGTLTVTGATNFYMANAGDLSLTETAPNTTPVYSAGGFYRIRLQLT